MASSSSPLPTSPSPTSPTSPPDSQRLALPAPSPPTFPHSGSAVPIILWDIEDNTCRTFNENPPKYIILSHSYEDDTKDSRLDFITCVAKKKGIRYVWLDTHCMGKTQDEISRSVESMFKYYHRARFCCVWLRGLDTSDVWDKMYDHPYFNESWLLHDLLASKWFKVYAGEGSFVGHFTKKNTLKPRTPSFEGFLSHIANSMRIPLAALTYSWPQIHSSYTVAQKLSWAAGRGTRCLEDRAYSLLGILDVSILVTYPDGNAFRRLQQGVVRRHPKDESIFAWGLGRSPESSTGGLWAASPDEFAGCNGVFYKEITPAVDRWLMQETPRDTLLLSAPIVYQSEAGSQHHSYMYGLINCGIYAFDGKLVSIGIPLGRNGDKVFRPIGIAVRPFRFSLPPYLSYPHNIEITPDVCPHGERRFSLAFDPGLRDIQHLFVTTFGPAPAYRLVRDKESNRIWHFESYAGFEAPTKEEFHIKIGQLSPSMDFLAIKLELSWDLRTCHWYIQGWRAALAKGNFENYRQRRPYYGSVLRVEQTDVGVFCIAKG